MKNKASKRYKKLLEVSKDKKIENINDAITKVKKNCTSKFDESIDVSLLLNLKSKKEETNLRFLKLIQIESTNIQTLNRHGRYS